MRMFANSHIGLRSHVGRELSLRPRITGFTDRLTPQAVSGVPLSTTLSPVHSSRTF